ncbi:hypothetical protein HELRODRAFT_177430 [Helobdella robusta]|uniref:DUF4371 domain-containing protein n=1 Tax=Helobdella robusta TaxID=6412 RepID=T1FBP3_HELRO|nr:hypothetical protein HELRODRAFT_177430 [Helobdella robusta]ESN98183.1 hypothetical protein HELRODRAFT_177430 [Helobdella robusta]
MTGCNVEKILGIVKIASITGQAQANATFQLLKLWDVSEDIIGMCFDTTAANTGTSSGACVLLEKLLHRNLLHFACGHHVHELIIGEVFTVLFGPSRGPNIGMFERFRAYWPNINQSNHKPLDDDRMNHSLLQMMRFDIVPSLTCFLSADSSYIPREDYKELVELCLLVLGYPMQTDGKYHFRVPGAYHMARWMAKVIYCLKMYLFRNEFKLTATETKSLTEFCLFATHIYVPAWMLCPIPSDAPDLPLFQKVANVVKSLKVVNDTAERTVALMTNFNQSITKNETELQKLIQINSTELSFGIIKLPLPCENCLFSVEYFVILSINL